MGGRGSGNVFDRLRGARRVAAPVEVAFVERFGRSPLSVVFRTPVLVLHSVGRRSGQERSTAIAYDRDTDGSLLIAGGAGGQTRLPDWVANLRATPRAAVTVDQPHRRRAVELTGRARAEMWLARRPMAPESRPTRRRASRAVLFRLLIGDAADDRR